MLPRNRRIARVDVRFEQAACQTKVCKERKSGRSSPYPRKRYRTIAGAFDVISVVDDALNLEDKLIGVIV